MTTEQEAAQLPEPQVGEVFVSDNDSRVVPVLDASGERIPNLFTRAGVFYIKASVRGKRYLRRCPYHKQRQAAKWVQDFIGRKRSERADDREYDEALRFRSASPSVGVVVERYRQVAMAAYRKDGTPVVKTIENNIRMLRRVLEVATGRQDVLSLNVSVLTDDLEAKYREACAAGAGADEVRRHRARVSAASTLRQAKSVFARWCLAEYRAAGMQFPESLAGFLAARRRAGSASVKAQAYTRRPDELVRATMDGAERLRLERPDLYAVFCLSYFQGMRAGEIAEARWSWVEQQDGQRVIRICRRPDWRGPKNLKDHSVPMTDDTWAALQAVRGDSPFIVPGASFTARRNLIGRTFAQWMRAVGWDPEVYPKAAHELRKLAGAVWYTKAGLQWAARWLGDTAAVVDHFYAALTNVGAPVDMRAI